MAILRFINRPEIASKTGDFAPDLWY